jgi:hypothetical protein
MFPPDIHGQYWSRPGHAKPILAGRRASACRDAPRGRHPQRGRPGPCRGCKVSISPHRTVQTVAGTNGTNVRYKRTVQTVGWSSRTVRSSPSDSVALSARAAWHCTDTYQLPPSLKHLATASSRMIPLYTSALSCHSMYHHPLSESACSAARQGQPSVLVS